jgi:deoxyhypusine synthase
MGNMYASHVMTGDIVNVHTVRTGIEYMTWIWPTGTPWSPRPAVGRLLPDRRRHRRRLPHLRRAHAASGPGADDVPLWGYFCQIGDSTTSYGSYSGAVPNEKITWGKLGVDTPKYMIESDATIVAPLIFAYVLADE